MAKVSGKKLELDWEFGYWLKLSIKAAKTYREYRTEYSLIEREYYFGLAQAYGQVLCPKIDVIYLITSMTEENSDKHDGDC